MGAQECREIMPEIHTGFSANPKRFGVSAGNQCTSSIFFLKNTKISANNLEIRELTYDFPADVEAHFLPPRRPEDRCYELLLVAGLVA